MKEAEIRPLDLFSRYLALAREDAEKFFDQNAFVEVQCPGCGSDSRQPAFEKFGFRYVLCQSCGSLYNSPRPARRTLDDYYRHGKAVQFWGSEFYRITAESRREKLFRPRAQLMADLFGKYGCGSDGAFLDIGPGYGIFLEELRRHGRFQRVIGVEPSPGLADTCRKKGFEIVEKYGEDLSGKDVQGAMLAAFEVLEHVFEPVAFLKGAGRVLKDRGLMVFTTLTVSGFDLQVLWEHSNSIFPPHHINLLSVEGIQVLVARSGYEIVELTTPGKLDVDIVANAIKDNSEFRPPRFVSYILNHRDERARARLQEFLQDHLLSSHVRVVARKRSLGGTGS